VSDAARAYRAVALQLRCEAVSRCAGRDESQRLIDAALDRAFTATRGAMAFFGRDARLFVLPEYFLTSFPMGEPAADWIAKACIRIPGPEIERVAGFAASSGAWICGNSYEADPAWPRVYFQASWIVGPDGLALKYRRLNSLFSVSPHDMWTAYRQRHSLREVFPVADTPLGRLAAIASEEILYPEVARCLMMHGAEVFVHSTSDVGGHPRMPKEVAKLARAVENMAYVVSANTAGIGGIAVPANSTDGRSKIVDYRGLVLAEADQGETIVATAEVDLEALRRYRRQEGMQNLIARQRFELYAPMYAAHSFCPPDQFPALTTAGRDELLAAQRRAIARLVETGIIQ
jgi:predicted amidohydrolase